MIGILLGLPTGTLGIIEHNNHFKVDACCITMLEKWLEVDPAASWEKIYKAVESSLSSNENHSPCVCVCVCVCVEHII